MAEHKNTPKELPGKMIQLTSSGGEVTYAFFPEGQAEPLLLQPVPGRLQNQDGTMVAWVDPAHQDDPQTQQSLQALADEFTKMIAKYEAGALGNQDGKDGSKDNG